MLENVELHMTGDVTMARGASRLLFRWLAVVLVAVLVFSGLYALVQALNYY